VGEALDNVIAQNVDAADGKTTRQTSQGRSTALTFSARRLHGLANSTRIVLALTDEIE
jgi:hypothetical protein